MCYLYYLTGRQNQQPEEYQRQPKSHVFARRKHSLLRPVWLKLASSKLCLFRIFGWWLADERQQGRQKSSRFAEHRDEVERLQRKRPSRQNDPGATKQIFNEMNQQNY